MIFSEVQLGCVASTVYALGRALQDKLAFHCFIPFVAVLRMTVLGRSSGSTGLLSMGDTHTQFFSVSLDDDDPQPRESQ